MSIEEVNKELDSLYQKKQQCLDKYNHLSILNDEMRDLLITKEANKNNYDAIEDIYYKFSLICPDDSENINLDIIVFSASVVLIITALLLMFEAVSLPYLITGDGIIASIFGIEIASKVQKKNQIQNLLDSAFPGYKLNGVVTGESINKIHNYVLELNKNIDIELKKLQKEFENNENKKVNELEVINSRIFVLTQLKQIITSKDDKTTQDYTKPFVKTLGTLENK